jgi:hypothetical protein
MIYDQHWAFLFSFLFGASVVVLIWLNLPTRPRRPM